MRSPADSSNTRELPGRVPRKTPLSIRSLLEERGVSEDVITATAMELYVPHPGIETREKAEKVFREELTLAISDPNLCLLLYAALLLEEAGEHCELPDLPSDSYKRDLTYLIVDEVLGDAIAAYIAGYKGRFEYVRFDRAKPGILKSLGPFLDDAVAGLIGGISSNMYTRGMKQE